MSFTNLLTTIQIISIFNIIIICTTNDSYIIQSDYNIDQQVQYKSCKIILFRLL